VTATRAIKLAADALTITGAVVLLIALVTTTVVLAIVGAVLVVVSIGLAGLRRAVAARARS
jgi:hypothetical protein